MKISISHNAKEMSTTMIKNFYLHLNRLLMEKEYVNIAIATGNTLNEFMNMFSASLNICYNRINLYVVDEYAGIDKYDERSCTIDLVRALPIYKKFRSVNCFSKKDYVKDIFKYNDILKLEGLDMCILGLGKDGHVAFCYPPYYDIGNDYYELHSFRRNEKQLHVANGWFKTEEDVPKSAITLSVWGILQSQLIMIGAIYADKKDIVESLIHHEIESLGVPALYLQSHSNITLYLG